MSLDSASVRLTDDQEKIFRTQAWSYFSLHAAQRMQSFQFYITLETALIGGAIVLAKSEESHQYLLALIGVAIAFVSFVFSKLDGRTRVLVKNAEAALKYLDDQHNFPELDGQPHPLRLFERDGFIDTPSHRNLKINISYTKCFSLVFWIFAISGAALALKLTIINFMAR